MTAPLTTHVENGIAELVLDDADGKNGLNDETCRGLEEGLRQLAANPEVRVVILRGRLDVFCSGATKDQLEKVTRGQAIVRDLELPGQIIGFPLPIIAAMEGPAVGGGLMLALCCDILVASEGARYGVNFTDMGFTPGMGATYLLPSLAGHAVASEMLFSGKLYRGRELKERGLFNHVVPRDEVLALARDLAERVAGRSRNVLELLKETLALPRRQALLAAMSREHLMHAVCFRDPRFSPDPAASHWP